MAEALSSLDLFRKIPADLTHATTHGGALTLLVFTTLSSVLILETWTYVAGSTHSKIVLDRNTDDKLALNFAVTFLELPCRFAEVEMWDYLGNAKLDISGQIERNVVSGDRGQFVGKKYDRTDGGIVHPMSDGSHDVLLSDYVFDATAESFGIKLKQHTFTFVLFYVEWCMFCKIVSPIWHELGKAIKAKNWGKHIAIARVDCVAEARLCMDSKIAGYPTILMFRDVHPLADDYRGHRNVPSFMDYIEKITDVENKDNVASVAGEDGSEEKAAALPEFKEQWHEGCLMRGKLEVNRVPGNFHISAKSKGHNFDQKSTNTSHIVHELTFGPRLKYSMLKKIPLDVRSNINPLEGDSFVNRFGNRSHEHIIKVVSTHYQIGTILGSSEIKGYQMAVSSHQYDADPNVPTARFSYDLAPTAVVISQVGRRWYEFFTSLCAIIGGMFTSFQILNGVMGSVTKHVAAPAPEILSPRPTSGVRSPLARLSG